MVSCGVLVLKAKAFRSRGTSVVSVGCRYFTTVLLMAARGVFREPLRRLADWGLGGLELCYLLIKVQPLQRGNSRVTRDQG